MNFYSEDIINHIIDTEDIENIVDEIETFYENVFMTFCYYSNTIVNPLYIRSLLYTFGHFKRRFSQHKKIKSVKSIVVLTAYSALTTIVLLNPVPSQVKDDACF